MTHCREATTERLVELFGAVKGVGGVKDVIATKGFDADDEDLPVLGVYFANEFLKDKAGHQPGRRIVQRTMNFFAVYAAVKPVRLRNSLEADQGAVMAKVESLLASHVHLRGDDGRKLLSDLKYAQAGTGYDQDSGSRLALAAVSIVAVAHHAEGDATVTLPQAIF